MIVSNFYMSESCQNKKKSVNVNVHSPKGMFNTRSRGGAVAFWRAEILKRVCGPHLATESQTKISRNMLVRKRSAANIDQLYVVSDQSRGNYKCLSQVSRD